MATVRKSQNGWPVHPTSAGCVSLSWITGRVDPRTHDLFDRFCQRFNSEVETIVRAHSWGYANRAIRGSSVVSNHASGTAIDLNAPAHPMGKRGTFTAKQEKAIRAILRDFPQITWGEDWSRPDGMHFELNVKPGGIVAVPRMASPAVGYIPDGGDYGPRDYAPSPWHAGLDITNKVGTPVYAPFAGKVRAVGANIAPYRSGDRNILISNPDGEGNYFGHLNKALVKVGQKVKAGQKIGEIGARGNVTGPHLHLEMWANWRDPSSHYDPEIVFRKYGIRVGSALSNPDKTPPSSGGSPAPKPKEWDEMASKEEIQDALWDVLSRDINVGGGKTRPLYGMVRDIWYQKDVAADIPRQIAMYDVKIGGRTKAALGVDSRNVAQLYRDAAASTYEGREQHAATTVRLRALQAAVHELAKSQGLDADKIDAAIEKAVTGALSDLKITLTTED